MTRVTYTATGQGQATSIRVNGVVYTKGQTYTLTDAEYKALKHKGGFVEIVKPSKKAQKEG